jgi:hypothetical protein
MVVVYISSCLFVVKAKSPSKTRRQFAPPYCSRISRHAAQEVRTRSHINLVIRLLGGLGTAWHIHDAMAANKIIRSRLVLELVAKIRSGGSSCLPRRREKGERRGRSERQGERVTHGFEPAQERRRRAVRQPATWGRRARGPPWPSHAVAVAAEAAR